MRPRIGPLAPPTRAVLAVLGCCFVFSLFGRGVMEAYAVFILPLSAAFGWDRNSLSAVYSLAYLAIGWSGPLVGWLCDRYGPVAVYAGGLVLAALGTFTAAQAEALWQFYLALGLCYGLAAACLGSVSMASLMARWFRERLNSALAFGYASGSVGILLMAPLAQQLIDRFDWRAAYLVFSVLFVLALPLLWLLRRVRAGDGHPDFPVRRPGRGAAAPPADAMTLRRALRSGAFWGLIFTFSMTGIGMFTVILQVPAFLVEAGYTPQFAAQAFGAIGLLAPLGMLGFGWLGDRIGRRNSILLSYALTVFGMASLLGLTLGPSLALVTGFVICFGGTFGSRGPAISAIAAGVFRGPAMASIYGCITVGQGLGGALGAWFGGFWHDQTGGYAFGLCFAMAALAFGAAPFLAVRALARA
jgi:MFS family permease